MEITKGDATCGCGGGACKKAHVAEIFLPKLRGYDMSGNRTFRQLKLLNCLIFSHQVLDTRRRLQITPATTTTALKDPATYREFTGGEHLTILTPSSETYENQKLELRLVRGGRSVGRGERLGCYGNAVA
jgi:hypothetical protein